MYRSNRILKSDAQFVILHIVKVVAYIILKKLKSVGFCPLAIIILGNVISLSFYAIFQDLIKKRTGNSMKMTKSTLFAQRDCTPVTDYFLEAVRDVKVS